MSQLHQEGLRRQFVADKRTATADLSWFRVNSTDQQKYSRSSSGSVHSASPNSTHSANYGVPGTHNRSGLRSKEVVITDPYLDALTKNTRAITRKRFTSTDYLMQW